MGKASSAAARIGLLQLRRDRGRRHPISRQPLGVKHHAHLPRQAADDLRLGDIVNPLELVFQFTRDLPQLVAVIVLAPQRHRHDGHIVDGADFDQRLRDAGGNAVEIGVQLVVGLDDRVFFLGPHVEAHHQHAQLGAGDGVHVLHARDLAQQALHGDGGPLLHLRRRGAWHLHKHIEHGHDDLGLFLARSHQNREGTGQQRTGDEQRRQLRIDEGASDQSGDPKRSFPFSRHRHFAPICLPPSSRSPGCATMRSPFSRPERTSTSLAEGFPSVTYRRLAISSLPTT